MTEPDDTNPEAVAPSSEGDAPTLSVGRVIKERLRTMSEHPFHTSERKRYVDRKLLGWGGMGQVYAVRDERLNREVAQKQESRQTAEDRAERSHPAFCPRRSPPTGLPSPPSRTCA